MLIKFRISLLVRKVLYEPRNFTQEGEISTQMI